MEKAVADVACGKAIVVPKEQVGQVPGLRVSPVGVVEKRENTRIIHDMTFEHRDGQGGGSVNATTDWEEISKCALACVMREVLQRVLGYGQSSATERGLSFKTWMSKHVQEGSGRPRRRSGLRIRAGSVPHCRLTIAVRLAG